MTSFLRLAFLLPVAALVAHADIDRTLARSFTVAPGDRIVIDVPTGPIKVTVGTGDTVELRLLKRINASSDSDADAILADYAIATTQADGTVKLHVRSPKAKGWFNAMRPKVKFTTELTVPATVDLDLDTAGGQIAVSGLLDGDLRADTSGGAISVTGGTGTLNLDTSGGAIRVGQALGSVRADTSGGSIRIAYVGPAATDVNADTSGGSISIGVDPAGHWDITADTSGGGVKVTDLTLTDAKFERSSASGRLNRGGQRLRADTSGGSITIRSATPAAVERE